MSERFGQREQRKSAFKKLGKAISKLGRKGPTAFNKHYEFRSTAVQDPALSSTLGNRFTRLHKSSKGPQMKTVQWEGTGSKRS